MNDNIIFTWVTVQFLFLIFLYQYRKIFCHSFANLRYCIPLTPCEQRLFNMLVLFLSIYMDVSGFAGRAQKHRILLCRKMFEKRRCVGRWWCGVHTDRAQSVSLGDKTSIPMPSILHVSNRSTFLLHFILFHFSSRKGLVHFFIP